jgi:hypothetical protein
MATAMAGWPDITRRRLDAAVLAMEHIYLPIDRPDPGDPASG